MIEVTSVSKSFRIGKETLQAVREVSFKIEKGEILGLVGESGCGKSTLGKMIVGLEEPSSGQILFNGAPLKNAKRTQLQMIFQDPFSSLNPRMTVEAILKEPTQIHRLPSRVDELLDLVGLPASSKTRYPHEFSGGQKQRIGIARALALKPDVLVCDEPISALDVSIQAQIISLLQRLQKELGLTYLFIAHDLAIVRYLSTRTLVMYHGSIVESAPTSALFANPTHPYTQLLLASVPLPNPLQERLRPRVQTRGEPLSPFAKPKGCPFASRCPHVMERCREEKPELKKLNQRACGIDKKVQSDLFVAGQVSRKVNQEVDEGAQRKEGHFVACHLRIY